MQPQGPKRFFTLALALTLASVISLTGAEEEQPSGGRAAVVNGSVITQEDFDGEMRRVQQVFSSRGTPLSDSQLLQIRKEVLESLINRELLYQQTRKEGIEIDETAVDEQLGRLKSRFPTETEFKSALQGINLSEADLEAQIRREMAIQELVDEQLADSVTVSDKETKIYYDSHPEFFKRPEEVRASHILIKVDPQANELQKAEARAEIEKIQKKLQEGEDFATLAKEFSQGPTGVRGGDLSYFRRGQMVKPFEDVAFSLKPGEVSGIVETRFGYHLIKVTDRRPEATTPYGDIKEKIEEHLKREKTNEETRRYLEALKETADVERFLNVEP